MVFLQDGDGIGADDILQGTLYGGEEVAFVLFLGVFDELHQHFRVGIAAEVVSLLLQFCAQGFIVFYDAVVHQ